MIRPAGPGQSIVARENDVILWHEESNQIEVIASDLAPPGSRLNEGSCTPWGSLLIGSLAAGAIPGGAQLMEVNAHEVNVILPSVTVSNGLGFSPDGTRAYFADSPTHRVDVFTVTEAGQLIERRPLTEFDPAGGAPDGLWVDEQGGMWVAMYGGSRVQRLLPTGKNDVSVAVDARQVTSCTFGGPDLSTLYITTSRENLSDLDDPLAGSIFHADVGIRGLEVLPFHTQHTPDHSSVDDKSKGALHEEPS